MMIYKYNDLKQEVKDRVFINFKREVRFSVKARSVKEINKIIEKMLIDKDYSYDVEGNLLK